MNPTLSWERIGSGFFRTFDGYSLVWDLDLSEYHVRVSNEGGLVAVWDNLDKIRTGLRPQRQLFKFFSGSGKLLLSAPWDGGAIVDAGFIADEQFVVVASSGHVRTYYDLEGNFELCILETPPKSAKFNKKAVVELETAFAVVGGPRVEYLKFRASGEPSMERTVWAPLFIKSGGITVEKVLVVVENEIQVISNGPTTTHAVAGERLAVSPDNTLVAVTSANETVVWRADFSSMVATAMGTDAAATGMAPVFIGSDGLLEVVHAADELEAVVHDWSGASKTLYFEPDTLFFSAVDGVRVLTNDVHNLFSKVLPSCVATFMLGSNAPSAILLSCIDQMDQNSPLSNENLALISNLEEAVDACLETAQFEFDVRLQKRLLKAAHFGKTALNFYDSTKYIAALNKIRITNTLRQYSIFCSTQQLATTPTAVNLLKRRGEWSAALGVAKLYELPIEPVAINWACTTIQRSQVEDEALLEELERKLQNFPGLSYVEISRRAFDEGRIHMARQLIGKEPNAQRRAAMLIEMREYDRALETSVASGDTGLVRYVLSVLSRQLSLPAFYRCFRDNQLAIRSWQGILAVKSRDELHNFNYQLDRRQDDLRLQLSELLADPDPKLIKNLGQAHAHAYTKRALADYAKLLETQEKLQDEYSERFVGLSAVQTLEKMLHYGQLQRVQKLKGVLGVDDKQVYWLRLRELIARRDWDSLWHLSQERKSPIGYEPFYNASRAAGNLEAAATYIELCSGDEAERQRKRAECEVGV